MPVRTPGEAPVRLERDYAPIPLRHVCRPIPVTSRLFRAPVPMGAQSKFAFITRQAAAAQRPVVRGVPGRFALVGVAGAVRSATASALGAFAAAASGSARRQLSASAFSAFAVHGRGALRLIFYEAFVPADQEEALVDADGETFMSFITSEGTE